jgi:enediyne biosynthesis protein E4
MPVMVLAVLWCTVAMLWPAPSSPGRAPSQSVQLTDVTRAARIAFVHSFGDARLSNIIEGVGGGAAWLDYDQDGHVDLYLATGRVHPGLSDGAAPAGSPRNTLYRNRGDGTFEDVTARAGVGCDGCFSMGLAVGDFDNDGWPDVFVANHGADALFRNQGNGTFRDVAGGAGVSTEASSVAATWLDYDKDGRLDLYVANYLVFDPKYRTYYSPDGFPGPLSYAPQSHSLYRNLGNGRFEDVSRLVRLGPPGRGMGVTAADWDGDGWDDIYVSNDGTENFLLRNAGGKRFEEIGGVAGVGFNGLGDVTASMAVDAGDYDNDGDLDLFVSDNALSSLFRNDGAHFTDVAVESGIGRTSAQFVGWGSFFFDVDNDGDLDIFKGNSDLSRPFGQEDQLYENNGSGLYREAGGRMGPYFQEERMSRGAAFADFDNDGDADVVINALGGPAILLRNDGGNAKNSLILRLAGRASNRDGVGARVQVTAGGRRIVTQKRSASGYLSQNDPRLLIGIGEAKTADVEIVWPSGRRQKVTGVTPGRAVTIEEPGS